MACNTENYDDGLIRAAIAGDRESFEKLYGIIYKDMYRIAYYMLNNREDALDAVSDAVCDIYKYIGGLRDSGKFGSWYKRILWTKCMQKRKEYVKEKGIIAVESSDIHMSETRTGNMDGKYDEQSVEKVMLEKLLLELKSKDRMIVLLSAVYGYNSREIAKILNMRSGTVRSILSRTLSKMRERIGSYEE